MMGNGNSNSMEAMTCANLGAMPQLNLLPKTGATKACENSDYGLVRDALEGNHAAFAELVRHHDRAILRLALHLTGSPQDAQDLCQETFLKAYRKLSSFRFESSFATWLHRIAANSCLGFLRKQRTRKASHTVSGDVDSEEGDLLDRIPDEHPLSSPEHALMNDELRRQIAHALQSLTPRERMLFELRHYHGLKIRVAAEMLNTSEESAKTTLFRATRKLREKLALCHAKAEVLHQSGGPHYFPKSCRLLPSVSDLPSRDQ